MNIDCERMALENLEEKNELLLKIITLQDEVVRLNKKIFELNEQIEMLKNTSKESTENIAQVNSFVMGNSKQPRKNNHDRYFFEGEIYKKNRLVLAVIQKYVELNKGISAEKLMEEFPKTLQGSLGTVRFVSDVREIYSECAKRFFMANQELIETPTGIVTVCSQWHEKNIQSFIDCAKSKGMQITIERSTW